MTKINNVVSTITMIAIALGIIVFIWGAWSCKRRINYNLGYKGIVQEQVQKEVALINARLDAIEKRLK